MYTTHNNINYLSKSWIIALHNVDTDEVALIAASVGDAKCMIEISEQSSGIIRCNI